MSLTECVGSVNLVDSSDHIYVQLMKNLASELGPRWLSLYLNSISDKTYKKYKILVHTI